MHKILYLFLIVILTACGQSSSDKIKTDIKNARTDKHINIPGTRLYLIPPANFSVAKTFVGIQKGENAMMNIYDLVGGNYYTNAATFSKSAFEQKGATVFDYQEIKVNDYPAKYISMQGEPTAKAFALVFGDTTFSTMIMCVYPATDEATGKEIINSLNTLWYDKNKKIDPLETANFSVDENESRFKFQQYSANMYVYSLDGKANKDDKDAPMVLISQVPKDNSMTAKDILGGMIGKMEEYGLTNTEMKNASVQKINGYDAYTIEVYGQMKGNSSLIYYSVIAKEDLAIVVQGLAKNDIENNLAEFKKLAGSVKLK